MQTHRRKKCNVESVGTDVVPLRFVALYIVHIQHSAPMKKSRKRLNVETAKCKYKIYRIQIHACQKQATAAMGKHNTTITTTHNTHNIGLTSATTV